MHHRQVGPNWHSLRQYIQNGYDMIHLGNGRKVDFEFGKTRLPPLSLHYPFFFSSQLAETKVLSYSTF